MGSTSLIPWYNTKQHAITIIKMVLFSALTLPTCCKAFRPGQELRGGTRRLSEIGAGATSKHLYCKPSGGCSQCQEGEEIERYCADTGYKELLGCTTTESLKSSYPVVLTYPYPPDVHIDDDRDEALVPGGGIRVVRSCTEKTVVAHQAALAAEVAAVEAAGGALSRMPLFKFELIMCGLLGLSLPVVYWRKIRIRHL